MKLINIGYGNMVTADKIVAIVSPDSAPVKRLITESRDDGNLIDATHGKKTKSVIITSSEHIILSSVTTKIISSRIDKEIGDISNE